MWNKFCDKKKKNHLPRRANYIGSGADLPAVGPLRHGAAAPLRPGAPHCRGSGADLPAVGRRREAGGAARGGGGRPRRGQPDLGGGRREEMKRRRSMESTEERERSLGKKEKGKGALGSTRH